MPPEAEALTGDEIIAETRDDIEAKFRANAKLALPMDRIERILDGVQHLEKIALTRELSDLLLKA